MKDLLTIQDVTAEQFEKLMKLSAKIKAQRYTTDYKPLAGKSIGMIFAKSSTRTRISFEVGIHELGGYPLYLDQGKMQVERGETIADTARVLDRYLHGLVIRTFDQSDVEELAANASFPVINALTNEYHPCQVLTDMFTIYEYSGKFEGVKMTYVGDGDNNMANSMILGAKLAGIELVLSTPEEFKPNEDVMNIEHGFGKVSWEKDPIKAVENADYIYTDVFVSMGFEEEAKRRLEILKPYQLNMTLLKAAKPDAKVLHCLPAHRDEEITDEVIESEQSIVFDQAENRLHVQKAIMAMLVDENAYDKL
ncbi:ornithine carbamoyltransferase [Lentisphaerae bacterium WC36]|nr:ornithine carbamoyltransferase [Lentisphaerae bacterium WC36]